MLTVSLDWLRSQHALHDDVSSKSLVIEFKLPKSAEDLKFLLTSLALEGTLACQINLDYAGVVNFRDSNTFLTRWLVSVALDYLESNGQFGDLIGETVIDGLQNKKWIVVSPDSYDYS